MHTLRILLLCSCFALIATSCSKSKQQPVPPASDISSYYDCFNKFPYDSITVSAHLPGTWELIESYSPWTQKTTVPVQAEYIQFKMNHQFSIITGGIVTQSGTWSLTPQTKPNYWYLNLDTTTIGQVLFCENTMLISDSYVDGNNDLYKHVLR